MKPILYNATETLFDSYGLGEMSANKATVTRERNGNYSLYIEYPVGGSLTPLFKQDMRIKADAGVRTKNQTFYISRIVKDSSHVIKLYAKHISHLTETMGIVHGTTAVGDANAALARWSESLVGGVEFRTWSDIETEGKASWTVDKFRTAREALGGVEGSILDIWGGEYEFDNTTIKLHRRLGRQSPTVLEYGRNILSAEDDEDANSVYTSVYPFATYTPESQSHEEGKESKAQDPVTVTLPEKIVDSQWVGHYAERRVAVVDFSSKYGDKQTPTAESLRNFAKEYMKTNRIGIPKINTKIEYVDLAKTLDYADMSQMEEVELCDIVPIFYPKIGLTNEDGKVVVVNYDVLNDRNESIEIGTIGQGMKSAMVGSLGEKLEALENQQTRLESNIPAYLLDGKGNKVWYQTPDNTREHKVGDTWFEKNGLYDRIYVWNGEMWEKRIDTEDVDVIAKEIDNKFKDFKSSTKLIEQKAQEALKNAGASSLLAQESKRIGLDSVAKLEEFKRQSTSAQMALSGDLDVLKRTIANDIRPKQAQSEAEIAKQVEALVQTKKELSGIKSAQATYEETTTRRLSELTNLANGKASKSELTQTAEQLASKIASVQASGRNLFLNSLFKQDISKTGIWTTSTYEATIDSTDKYLGHNALKIVGQNPSGRDGGNPKITYPALGQFGKVIFGSTTNQDVTISFYAKASTNGIKLRSRLGYIGKTGNVTLSTEIKRYVVHIPKSWTNESKQTTNEWLFNFDQEGTVWIWMPKFEISDVDTSYSEAPEDTDGQISAVESTFKQRADSLEVGVNRLTEGLRTKADISALNVTAENIRQSVKRLETDTQNNLNQKLSQAEFEVRADSIRQEILNATKDKADKTLVVAEAGKLREEFSKMKVGSRNYAEDYDFSRGLWYYTQGDNSPQDWTISNGEYNVKGTTNTWKQMQIYSKEGSITSGKSSTALLDLEIGETYTLSFQGICYSGSSSVWLSLRANRTVSGNPEIMNGNFNLTSSWQTYQVTIPALTKPENFDFWRIILGYNEIGHVAFRKVELTRSSTRIDAGPAPEDGKTDLVVAKSEFQKTAEGLSTKLAAVETYVNQDGQRQEALRRYTREESAKQATSVRELVSRDFVGKVSYQEDVRAIERKFEAITNPQNGSVATQIANYKKSVDGRFADISSLLSGKANQTDFQRVKETSQLYERILGNTENGIADKVARMAMTNQLFQVEVAKSLGSDNNLIVRSKSMDRHKLVNEGNTKRVFVNDGIFTIQCAGNSGYTFAGFTLPLYIDRMARGETYTLNFKYRIMGRLDHEFTVVAKNHQANEGIFSSNIATSSTAVSSHWKEFTETYNITKDFGFGTSNLYPIYFYLAKNGWIEIKEIMLVRASQTNGYKASQFDDMSEAVRSVQSQLAGSWAVQNINSAGDIISGINLGATGHNRITGKLTHITGETLIDNAVIKSAMIDKLKTANFEAGSVTTTILDAEAVTADKVRFDDAFINKITAKNALIEGIISKQAFINHLNSITFAADRITGGNLSATNGAMKIDLNKGQYEVYTEKAALRRVVAGYPNQFIKFDTGIQDVTGNREIKSGVTFIGSNSDGTENGNNQTFAGIQIWNNPQQRNVNSVGDFLRVSNKGYGLDEKGWIIQTIDTPSISPIVDKNKPETGKRSAIYSGDFYFINKWGQKVSLLGILERFIVNFNTIKDKRGMLYTDFSELN